MDHKAQILMALDLADEGTLCLIWRFIQTLLGL